MSCVMVSEETEVCPPIRPPNAALPRAARRRYEFDSVIRRAAEASSLRPHVERRLKVMIVVGAAVALATAILSGNLHLEFSLLPDSRLATLFWWTALLYGSITYAALVWRVILWRRYRPMAPVADQSLPTLSVVIPAYNEGALVRQSILSTAASHYPAEKLEIIAIDDGSTDDTWLHIRAAAGEVDPAIRIVTHKQPRNLGKREALNHGFSVGSGDVFVSMDSDSVLHPDALRNGVAPLVRDPSIGCVAGCVEVLNPRQSWITRFLRCTFSLSFKFVRAYQSEFRGVFCTPGALSFYRANIIRKVKDEWVRQTFLGQPCTIGEDRALTNLILREGWMTTYQGNALVYSEMPHTYVGLCKMLLRWGRSNVRETVVMAPWLLTNFRTKYLRRFQFNMLLTIVTLFLPPVLILNSWLLLLTQSGYLLHQLGLVMIYAATTSIIYYMNEKDNEWVWLFAYEFFWTSCLSWIIPWSVITVKNTKWLTRGASLRQGAVVDSPSPRSFSLPSLLAPGDAPILHPAVASPSR